MATAHRAPTACLAAIRHPRQCGFHTALAFRPGRCPNAVRTARSLSPPEDSLFLPKCRSAPVPRPRSLSRVLQSPAFHPPATCAPPGDFPPPALWPHAQPRRGVRRGCESLANPAGGLSFPFPTAVSFSTPTTRLTGASAAGRRRPRNLAGETTFAVHGHGSRAA